MKKYLFMALFLTSACSLGLSTEQLYFDADGNGVYQATCNGGRRSIGDCYKLAAQQCLGNFEIIEQDKNVTGSYSSFDGDSRTTANFAGALVGAYTGSGVTNNFIHRSIIFKCKNQGFMQTSGARK